MSDLIQISYRIIPTISDTGLPLWCLYQDYASPFPGGGTRLLAMNADRAVLEHAVEHLRTA